MKRARIGLTAVLLLSILFGTGCWSRKELNELAIVAALGIDLHKNGYLVTAQVMNSSEVGVQRNPSNVSVITYQASGKSIPDALQRILSEAPRQLYLSHIRILVFGEAVARAGLSSQLDFLSRHHQIRTDFYLLVAQQSNAADVLRVLTPFEHIPANSLFTSILVAHKNWAATGRVTLQQFVTELARKGAHPVLSGVRIIGNKEHGRSSVNLNTIDPDTALRHVGLAVFKDDKLVGWLDEGKSKSVNYVTNEVDSTLAYVDCPEDKQRAVSLQIKKAKSKTRALLDGQGIPSFIIDIRIEANIGSVQCAADLSKTETIQELERRLEDKVNVSIADNIRYIQRTFGSDIFGFGEVLHRKYPKAWNHYRKQWDDTFRQVKISVRSTVNIRQSGSIVQPVKREMERQ